MAVSIKKKRAELPQRPGVYFFKAADGKILYIGKAGNLKARVNSYFASYRDIGAAKEKMLRKAKILDWRETGSEIEALILEATLIKRYAPAYNILMRDDKNYTFVGFTKETFPHILVTHQPLDKLGVNPRRNLLTQQKRRTEFIGPFTDSTSVRYMLRALRRAFPYCTCKELHKRTCQQASLGLCLGICCLDVSKSSEILQREYSPARVRAATAAYRQNVKTIHAIFQGKHKRILIRLRREMDIASKARQFEKAAEKRNQIRSLERIFAHSSYISKEQSVENEKGARYLGRILGRKDPIERIEGYDISNILGADAVGSMVVFTDGRADKAEYRKFKIRNVRGANDPAMMREVLTRRFWNQGWALPDMILLDGGRTQLNAALTARASAALDARISPQDRNALGGIAIVAIAKREEELYLPDTPEPLHLKELPSPLLHFIQQVRDESHRFAVNYHRKLHRQLPKN